jgi:hypothetical protein
MRAPIQKLLLLLIFTAVSLGMWANVSQYSFASTLGTYAEITGGTVHGTVANDNESFNAIPLGFNFTYNGVIYDNVSIQSNGFIVMGTTGVTSNTAISGTTNNNLVSAMNRDIKSRENGELMSLTSGTAPNRVFTVQWSHYRRVPTTTANDDFSFQIKFLENGNVVQFVYGPCLAITSASAAAIQVGIKGDTNADFNNRATTTDWSATTAGTANNSNCSLSATVFPANGLTFAFTPPNIGDPPLAAQNPNPANGAVNVAIGANLTWVIGGGVTDGYKVYLGTDPAATNIVNGATQTAVTYNPDDFAYSTIYYWKIVPFNQHGDALNCPIWSFTTLADPTIYTFPHAQGFENVTPPALALGWTTINANSDAYTWESVGSGAQAGTKAMRCRYNSTLAMNDWLVTPALHLTLGTTYKARFYYRADAATSPEKLSVYLGTAPTTAALTTLLFTNQNINNITYAMAEAVINPTATGNYYIGFQGHSNMAMTYLYLDTFSIFELIDVINPPQNFAANVIDDNDVVLTWSAPATRDLLGYKLYRNGTLIHTISTPATLTYTDMNLAVGNYSYTLTAYYDGGESTPAGPVAVTITALLPPANLAASIVNYNNVHLTWDAPGTQPPVNNFTDGFETYPNFALTFAPWTLVDVDLSVTYGIDGTTFQNSASPMSYIIFNPSATTPAMTTLIPHGGAKMAASFASVLPAQGGTGPNNDWLISPAHPVVAGNVLNFWARSYVSTYGLERFKVGISTTGTSPANFTIISGANYISAPITWTQYNYSLAAYAGQTIYVGIQCISNDAFIFFVDDVFIGAPAAMANYPEVADLPGTTNNRSIVASNVAPVPTEEPTRALLGYKVYRDAALIATVSSPTTFVYDDMAVAPGAHAYTVTAYYSAGESVPAGPINLTILAPPAPVTNLTATVVNSSVILNWVAPAVTTLSGFKILRDGVLIAETSTPAVVTYTQNNVPNGTYVYGVIAVHSYGASTTVTAEAIVNVQLAPAFFTDGFESYPDFNLTFSPWILTDIDLSVTYGIQGVTFPNSAAAMAYIIFNPGTTTPPLASLIPHGGAKVAASFAATAPPNNDYLITPRVHLGTNSAVRFYAKSYSSTYIERFRLGVSTLATPNVQAFQYVTGPNYVEVPAEWTEYAYDLSAYDGQNVYISIRCVSHDAFIFLVDDFTIHGNGVSNEDIMAPVLSTELKGNYPNPFNPETTINFSMKEIAPVSLEIYNVKGQLVKTLVNEIKGAGNHSVVWKGVDDNNRPVSSGVYFFKMNTGKYSSTKKMIMMK